MIDVSQLNLIRNKAMETYNIGRLHSKFEAENFRPMKLIVGNKWASNNADQTVDWRNPAPPTRIPESPLREIFYSASVGWVGGTPLKGCNPDNPIELKSMKRGPKNPDLVDFQKCVMKRWNKQKVEIQ